MLRSCIAAVFWCLLVGSQAACQSQTTAKGEQPTAVKPKTIELDGVDTSKLTQRENEQWSTMVSELLAPCSDEPVSVAQCVAEKRSCDTCLPAARFLTGQVTKGKTRSQAEDAFRARFSPDAVKSVEAGDSPAKGATNPAVTIVEWADFECPFCGMASPLLAKTAKKYPEQVQVVFKHYPLSAHEHAENAARAAIAAGKQGKFWEMHDLMFQNQTALDDKGIERLAKQVGLDIAKFKDDLKSEAVADAVNADRKQADKLGLRGTPMLFINGRHFDLETFDLAEDLEPWIELEVELRAGKPSQGPAPAVKEASGDLGAGGASAPATSARAPNAARGATADRPASAPKAAEKAN